RCVAWLVLMPACCSGECRRAPSSRAAAGVGGSPVLGWLGQASGCQLPSSTTPTARAFRNRFQPRPNTLQTRFAATGEPWPAARPGAPARLRGALGPCPPPAPPPLPPPRASRAGPPFPLSLSPPAPPARPPPPPPRRPPPAPTASPPPPPATTAPAARHC